MYRRIAMAIAGAAVAAALAIPALAASGATRTDTKFGEKLVGASISKTQAVYKVHDSVLGNGALVQTFTSLNSKGGTDTSVSYFGNAKAFSKDKFTFGKPQNGQIPFTGSGQDTGGTGKLKGVHATYTFSGSYDPKTTITHATVTGTYK